MARPHAPLQFFLGAIGLGLVACTATPPEPAPLPPVDAVSSTLAAPGGVPGYAHLASKSRFAIGSSAAMRSEFGLQKLVGSGGVFATRPRTSLIVAMPNADAPCRKRPPLPGGAPVHNAAVRDYFVSAGLPADQILAVEVYASMSAAGVGDELDTAARNSATLDHYFSVISRQVHGVKVLDSFAWARINADGEVVSESVYWPPLSAALVAEVDAFTASLAGAASRDAMLAKLPKDLPEPTAGQLFVRHTPGEWDGPFAAAASYDIGERNRILHVRADGSQFKLPHEVAAPLPPPLPKRK